MKVFKSIEFPSILEEKTEEDPIKNDKSISLKSYFPQAADKDFPTLDKYFFNKDLSPTFNLLNITG